MTTRHCERLENRLVFSTFVVSNLADAGAGSLRAAIEAANTAPGEDVIVFPGGLKGTINLSSQLSVTDDLTITGNSQDKIVVSGNNATRGIAVSGADTNVTIEQITISDGFASSPSGTALGGGLLNDGASVSLDHVAFKSNDAIGFSAGGGAIANLGGALLASHVDFDGNSVRSDVTRDCWGGAIYVDHGATAAIDHATFASNSATGGGTNGGAIFIADGSQVDLAHCDFDGNKAEGAASQYGAGGAIMAQSVGLFGSSSPTVNISHASFTNNRAGVGPSGPGPDVRGQGFGGAVMIEDGPTMSVEYSSFDGNASVARSGGDNPAGVTGRLGPNAFAGAVFNVCGTLSLRTSRFTNNLVRAGDGGGGGSGANGGAGGAAVGGAVAAATLMPLIAPPVTTIEQCEFVNNRAIGGNGGAGGSGGNGGVAGRADGGGVAALYGFLTMSDCTIFGNSAIGGDGGALGAGGARGGDGGLGRAGGLGNERGSIATVSGTLIESNQAIGGVGGATRPGGDAWGGGVYNGRTAGLPPDLNAPADLTLIDCEIIDNHATGGPGGAGSNGGNALGGGINNANPAPPLPGAPLLALRGTLVTGNSAIGGAAGASGTAGSGIGGGLYNQLTATASADALSQISGNVASTSDDDIFGTLTIV
jgi:hypothetical protein